ncbi:MAG: alpha/beta hydrolase family protein [Acidimicrobiia bacterium]
MIPTHSRRVALVATVLGLLIAPAACSSSSSSAKSTTAPSESGAPYAQAGPYAAGYVNLKLPDGRRAVVWYPARKDATKGHRRLVVDIASFLNPSLRAQVPAEDRVLYPTHAFQDAPAITGKGPFPIVLFSHGFAGYPEQSVSITEHLASWGFVVAAPDHVERSLDGLLGTASQGIAKSTDVQVLQATLAAATSASKTSGVLHGLVDAKRATVIGHSAGAGAAYALASADPTIKAFISYSVGFGGQAGPAPTAPEQPGMVMLGTTDGIIEPAASRTVYKDMNPPKYLVEIKDAGHLVFSDICLIGRASGGITGIARALKLPIPEDLLRLGSDGCTSDHPKPETAFPAINQLSVAFLRWAVGIDKKPIGLDTAAVRPLGGGVTVTATP